MLSTIQPINRTMGCAMGQATASGSKADMSARALGRGLRCLAILNEWERIHMPFIKSTSGRDLYFLIVKHFMFASEGEAAIPLKSFRISLSDKAMRQRILDFKRLGLVTLHSCPSDTRNKHIQPTPQLHDVFNTHTQIMRRCFQHYFHYVQKDNAVPLMDLRELPPPVP